MLVVVVEVEEVEEMERGEGDVVLEKVVERLAARMPAVRRRPSKAHTFPHVCASSSSE